MVEITLQELILSYLATVEPELHASMVEHMEIVDTSGYDQEVFCAFFRGTGLLIGFADGSYYAEYDLRYYERDLNFRQLLRFAYYLDFYLDGFLRLQPQFSPLVKCFQEGVAHPDYRGFGPFPLEIFDTEIAIGALESYRLDRARELFVDHMEESFQDNQYLPVLIQKAIDGCFWCQNEFGDFILDTSNYVNRGYQLLNQELILIYTDAGHGAEGAGAALVPGLEETLGMTIADFFSVKEDVDDDELPPLIPIPAV
jgi:hypothetical protein